MVRSRAQSNGSRELNEAAISKGSAWGNDCSQADAKGLQWHNTRSTMETVGRASLLCRNTHQFDTTKPIGENEQSAVALKNKWSFSRPRAA
jgi:hypothetical protein